MIPLNKDAGQLTSVGVVSVEEQPSVHKHGGERFYSERFLHILSKSEHGPEGRFAVPLSLPQERLCFSHGSKAPGSWTWLCADQTVVIHSGFHWLPTYNIPLNINLKLLFKTVSFKPGMVTYARDLSTE